MSEYWDEKILMEKRRLQQEQEQRILQQEKGPTEETKEESIFDGKVTIGDKKIIFERVEISELKISILMPDIFFLLSEDIKKFIYPAGNAPSHVYGGEDITYQLSLSKTTHQVPDDGMVKFLPIAKKVMELMGPKTRILDANVVEHMVGEDCYHLGIMEFISEAVDMSIYNVMFYISIENQLVMGNITFPYKFRKTYMKIAKETIDSLIVLKGDEA